MSRLCVSLALAIAWMPVSSKAGEKIGNGGDIRRFRTTAVSARVSRTLRELVAVSDFEHPCRDLLDGDLRAFAYELRKNHGGINVWQFEWVDDAPGIPCVTYLPYPLHELAAVRTEFNYQTCPLRADRDFYRNAFLGAVRETIQATPGDPDVIPNFLAAERALRECSARGVVLGPEEPVDSRRFEAIELGDWEIPAVRSARLDEARTLLYERVRAYTNDDLAGWAFDLGLPLAPVPTQAQLLRAIGAPVIFDFGLHSCAYTERKLGATIGFSPRVCAEVRNTGEFAWVLAHEIGHQFGLESEFDADRFAYLLLDVSENDPAFSW